MTSILYTLANLIFKIKLFLMTMELIVPIYNNLDTFSLRTFIWLSHPRHHISKVFSFFITNKHKIQYMVFFLFLPLHYFYIVKK